MTSNIISSSDYCPYCHRRTAGLKDFKKNEYLCKRCGKVSRLNTASSMNINTSPKKLEKSYVRWFKKRVI